MAALTRKDARIVSDPIKPETDLEIEFLKRPLIRKPIRGKKGTR
jgi:hypothetical protein